MNIQKPETIKGCKQFNLADENFYFYKCEVKINKIHALSYGIDACKAKAKSKAILEGIERYCACFDKESSKKIVLKSYNELKNKALHPKFLFSFSKKQYLQKNFKFHELKNKTKIYWIKGRSILTNKKIYIPASYVYCDYHIKKHQKKIGHSTSNGCAIAKTINEAILNGALELIERDSILINWLKRLPSPKIPLNQLDEKIKDILVKTQIKYGINILINDQTTDFKIPTISILSQSKNPPYFTFGSATHFSPEKAIIKALQESLLIRKELSGLKKSSSYQQHKDLNKIQTLYQHAEFYALKNKDDPFEFLLKSPYLKNLRKYRNLEFKYNTPIKQLNYLKNLCQKSKKEIFYVNLSKNIAEKKGLKAVRVIIPELYPLNSEYDARYLANARLRSLFPKTKPKHINKKLNPYPHPIG